MYDFKIDRRFWIPVTSEFSLESSRWGAQDDFTPDPDGPMAEYRNLAPVSEDGAPPCLVLLGEMGIGKTLAMEALRKEVESRGGKALLRPFVCMQSPDDPQIWIERAIQQNATLFLDGLDEFKIRGGPEGLREALQEQAGSGSRWRLRIACRSADWDGKLLDALNDIWDEEHVLVVRLAALTEADVRDAAGQIKIDGEAFLRVVRQRGLQSVARLPLSLGALFAYWDRHRNLGDDLWGIHEEACLALCRDHRGLQGQEDRLPLDQRLSIASALALTLRLGGKDGVLIDGGKSERGVAIEDVRWCAKREIGIVSSAVADRAIVEITTDMALFEGDSHFRYFDHQGRLDYLAAYSLAASDVRESSWWNLLSSDGMHVIPHLRGMAGWLCHRSDDLMTTMAEKDFATLLLAGVDCLTNELRVKMVEQVLRHPMQWQALSMGFGGWGKYRLLKHDGLAEQLRSWLQNPNAPLEARIEAASIAMENEEQALSGVLADLALDSSVSIRLRADAAMALSKMGKQADRLRLKVLMQACAEDDHDELKGYVLRALWPGRLITAEELFPTVDPPKRENFHGGYDGFLMRDLMPHLGENDLAPALDWVKRHGRHPIDSIWNRIVNEVIWRAWGVFLERSELQEPFLQIASMLLDDHQPVFAANEHLEGESRVPPPDHTERRQLLLALLIERATGEAVDLPHKLYGSDVLQPEDSLFLLLRAALSPSVERATKYASIVSRTISSQDLEKHWGFILELGKVSEAIKKAFQPLLGPTELASPQADAMRKRFADRRDFEKKMAELSEQRKRRTLPPGWRIPKMKELLLEVEADRPMAWIDIAGIISADESGRRLAWFGKPLQELDCWKTLPPQLIDEVYAAARIYLERVQVIVPEKKGTIAYIDVAGYVALTTLYTAEGGVEPLRRFVAKWVPAIVHQPVSYGTASIEEDIHKRLLNAALVHAPDTLVEEVLRHMLWESDVHDFACILYRFDGLHPDKLCEAFLEFTRGLNFDGKYCWDVLRQLLEWQFEEAFSTVVDAWRAARSEGLVDRAIGLASTLLLSTYAARVWDEIGSWLVSDDSIGTKVLLRVASATHRRRSQFAMLAGRQRLELQLFMEKAFSRSEDVNHIPDDAHTVGEQEQARGLRDELLRLFEQHGEVDELCVIRDGFPQYGWMDRLVARATEVRAHQEPRTLTPKQVEHLILQATDASLRRPAEFSTIAENSQIASNGTLVEPQKTSQSPASPERTMPKPPFSLFYSYCHADEAYRAELDKRLKVLEREELVTRWYDGQIVPGQEWDGEIKGKLESSQIIVLLVSADFIASDYIDGVEVKQAMERHEAGEACVIPVILRPCEWERGAFSKLQGLPKDARPISRWEDRDEAYLDVVRGIRRAIDNLKVS